MATIEQFVFTDRERGKGKDSTLDGGFQVAACSKGVLPECEKKLATIAGEVGRLFLNSLGMNSTRSVPSFGTDAAPLWCWTPVNERLWALTRSVYLGQSVSSSRPEGNYLFHALMIPPEDLSEFHNSPFTFAQFACKKDLFWSHDRGQTALNTIRLPQRAVRAANVDLSKVHARLSGNLAKADTLTQLLSLVVSLDSPSRRTLLVSGLDADESWKLMGMVLFLMPAFMRSRISLSNVCFATFVQSATTEQAFAAIPRGLTLAGSNRVTSRIGQVDAMTGRVEIADETYVPAPLMSWVVDHIDDLATKLYAQAEAGGLSRLDDYEALTGFFDLFQTAPLSAGSPPDLAAEVVHKGLGAALDKLASSSAGTAAPQGWQRGLLCELLETWYQSGDYLGVQSVLDFIVRRNIVDTVLVAQSTDAASEELGDFLDRLESRILNCLRLGNWCMVGALLEGFGLSERGDRFLKATQVAGASMRLPEAEDQYQVEAFSRIVRDVLARTGDSSECQRFLTDLLFVLLDDPEASGVFRGATVDCMRCCAGLLRADLDQAGQYTLDEDQLQRLCDSPHLGLLPELSLLCSRVRMQQLIRQQLAVMQTEEGGWDETSNVRLARQVAEMACAALRVCNRPEAEIDGILNSEIGMLSQAPPMQALAVGLMWPDVPETCRSVVFERFRRQPLLREDTAAEASANRTAADLDGRWRSWLFGQLVSHGKPDLAMKWAFASSDPGPPSEFDALFQRCGSQARESLVARLEQAIPDEPAKQSRYRRFVFGVADGPQLPASVRASLLKTVVRVIRPGDTPPRLLGDVSLRRTALNASDQCYVNLVQSAWKMQTRVDRQSRDACLWLDLWTDLQLHHVLTSADVLTSWAAGPRARLLTMWVLTWLDKYGISTPLDMEIIERLLRKVSSCDETTWTKALCLAAGSAHDSLIDLAALLVWFCRRNAEAALVDDRVAHPLQAMLTQVDSETLHQLSDVLQMPPEGMPPQLSHLLTDTIARVLTEREKTSSSDSQTKRRPRVSRLLRWAFRRDSESEQSPDAENGISVSTELHDKRNTEERSGAGSDS